MHIQKNFPHRKREGGGIKEGRERQRQRDKQRERGWEGEGGRILASIKREISPSALGMP